MIVSLIVYGLVVGLLAVVASRALEVAARAARIATRWVWIGAMALTIGLVGWAAAARSAHVAVELSPSGAVQLPFAVTSARSSAGFVGDAVAAARRILIEGVDAGSARAARELPAATGPAMLGLWVAVSFALVGVLVAVETRGRRKTEAMPEERLHGLAVRVSEATGPAVVGLAPPRIIVPTWLLARSANEQRAALAHEASQST